MIKEAIATPLLVITSARYSHITDPIPSSKKPTKRRVKAIIPLVQLDTAQKIKHAQETIIPEWPAIIIVFLPNLLSNLMLERGTIQLTKPTIHVPILADISDSYPGLEFFVNIVLE